MRFPKKRWPNAPTKPEAAAYYVGIDPGWSGGLAILHESGEVHLNAPMPDTESDLFALLERSLANTAGGKVVGVIEKVGGFIGKQQPGSAMFKFGWSYGGLRMALTALRVPFDEVVPQTWQTKMGVQKAKKGAPRAKFKNALKAKAQQLFPRERVTLKTADALLIAEFCRRRHRGIL